MTNSLEALKAAAEKAGGDSWQAKKIGGDYYVIRKGSHKRKNGFSTYQPIAEVDDKSVRDFIAMANPEDIKALIASLEQAQSERDKFQFAYKEWSDKTEWVQKENSSGRFGFQALGMHRADVMTRHIKVLEQSATEHALAHALLETTIKMQAERIAELEESHAQVIHSRDHYKRISSEGLKLLGQPAVKPVKLPGEFSHISENLRTQDNRVTSEPMFCVFQKREIVTHEDYDHDRIVWIDEDGGEATERQRMRLELLHSNCREAPEKWRRVALKEINDFVTCCLTEQGCKDYLECNGHNLRLPFIYVKSGFRNAEYQAVRNWLMEVNAGIQVEGE